jgi:NDP-sugar pyrophosphorylase family protein
MQIIIPMSGIGKRFIDAGYADPKPLITVEGIPVIEHVINMFPGESNFTFICNREHLKHTAMGEVLTRIAPMGKVMAIDPHKKGPVYAVARIFDQIRDDEEVIVNYCDFSKGWDYSGFLQQTRELKADGAISAYRGFHPHMLGTTNYAFMRNDGPWMLEIKEKEPFTTNRMDEFASDGTYYFRTGSLVKHFFQELIDRDININGEYYVSLVYNLMKQAGLGISIYEIKYMLQWGTPRDLEEYRNWSDYFRVLVEKPLLLPPAQKGSINLIPLAGRGQRFAVAGYDRPKPLIPVSGNAMIVQSASCLPQAERHIFVCLGEHLDRYPLKTALTESYPAAQIVRIDHVTEGQACTCELGLQGEDPEAPLFIGACDNGLTWNPERYLELVNDESVDAIVLSFRHHPASERNPAMYGWVKANEHDDVLGVSVKTPISADPYNDHAIVGAFYFRKVRYFLDAVRRLYEKNIRVNNEFYVDSSINELIEAGFMVKVFEVDHYICWGTPDDLKTFEYWQSFFAGSAWHPYHVRSTDEMVAAEL